MEGLYSRPRPFSLFTNWSVVLITHSNTNRCCKEIWPIQIRVQSRQDPILLYFFSIEKSSNVVRKYTHTIVGKKLQNKDMPTGYGLYVNPKEKVLTKNLFGIKL